MTLSLSACSRNFSMAACLSAEYCRARALFDRSAYHPCLLTSKANGVTFAGVERTLVAKTSLLASRNFRRVALSGLVPSTWNSHWFVISSCPWGPDEMLDGSFTASLKYRSHGCSSVSSSMWSTLSVGSKNRSLGNTLIVLLTLPGASVPPVWVGTGFGRVSRSLATRPLEPPDLRAFTSCVVWTRSS